MDDLKSTEYDPIMPKMLEARINHARVQKKDYSHVFQKKTTLDFVRLSALSMGSGFVIAAETAFVSPILLQIGVEHSIMTMVWGLSPILGLLFGPFVASISDRCRLKLGRRRPVILALSFGIVIGLVLLPYGRYFGQYLGDDHIYMNPHLESNITENLKDTIMHIPPEYKPNLKFAIILTIIGTVLCDFNVETVQAPARAYMLDVCIPEDQGKLLSIFSAMAGLGSAFGYIVGAIDWECTAIGTFLGGNIQAVFMIDLFLYIVCVLVTVLSFREIPLPLIERDELLRPITEIDVKGESLKTNKNNKNYLLTETLIPLTNEKSGLKFPAHYASSYSIDNVAAPDETVSLEKYLKNLVTMPKSMWILSLTNLLSWMGHGCYCLYFTDFVGETVFHGDPGAPVGSEEYKLYEAGVRFGGWGMVLYSLSCCAYSIIVEKLLVWFKPKHVYIFGLMTFAIGMYILAAWPTKLGVLVLSLNAGIIFATIYIVPYMIVADYHTKDCFEVRNGQNVVPKEPRGLGLDMAIISSMLFVAQLIMSLTVGNLVDWTETTNSLFYASSGISVCAAISAMFVLYI